MVTKIRDMEEAYRKQGWTEIRGADGSITFEKEAKPSVLTRRTVSLIRERAANLTREHASRRARGQRLRIRRKDGLHPKEAAR